MRLTRAVPILFALTLSVAARGDAPLDQYLTFSPTSQSITDKQTSLVWLRTPVGTGLAMPSNPQLYAAALKLCTDVAAGWRLPSVRELLSIVDEQPHLEHIAGKDVQLFIDPNAFPKTTPERYLAASPDPSNEVWWVDFGSGVSGASSTNESVTYAVRCVQ